MMVTVFGFGFGFGFGFVGCVLIGCGSGGGDSVADSDSGTDSDSDSDSVSDSDADSDAGTGFDSSTSSPLRAKKAPIAPSPRTVARSGPERRPEASHGLDKAARSVPFPGGLAGPIRGSRGQSDASLPHPHLWPDQA